MAELSSHQFQYAQIKFRAMVTESYGDEFEKLFHRLMESRYSDYVAIRTNGSMGDMGADGIRTETRQLFACYGPESFDAYKVRWKFLSDVESATRQRSGKFDKFVFVHNDRRGGIHPIISQELMNARNSHPGVGFEQMGPGKLWLEAMRLDRMLMEHVLEGNIPIEPEAYSIGVADIEPLLLHLAENRTRSDVVDAMPIPTAHKVAYNRLSDLERGNMQSGRPYGYLVDKYYRENLDLHERDEVAAGFGQYYELQRAQYGNDPDEVMFQMRIYVLGHLRSKPKREEAANAVLAYFFDQCDIFEVPPPDWKAHGFEIGATE